MDAFNANLVDSFILDAKGPGVGYHVSNQVDHVPRSSDQDEFVWMTRQNGVSRGNVGRLDNRSTRRPGGQAHHRLSWSLRTVLLKEPESRSGSVTWSLQSVVHADQEL